MRINIKDMGATDGSNITNIIEDCNNYLRTIGGEIYFPSGTYYLENAEILSNVRYVGAGWKNSILRLPAGATNPMFAVKTQDLVVEMSGFEHLTLQGIGTSGPKGIDFSKASYWHFGAISHCRIKEFSTGMYGSARDRRPYISFSQFWDNDVGYFTNGDHTQFHSCDFRGNRIGLSGNLMYDMQINNVTFAYNQHGVLPDNGAGGGSIQQTIFTNCQFFANTLGGATVHARVTFSNCLLAAATGTNLTTSFGVKFLGFHSAWIGGIVNQEVTTAWFGDAVFLLYGESDNCIKDVEFVCRDFIKTNPLARQQRHIISGNNGFCRGRFALCESDVNGNQGLVITNNTIKVVTSDTTLIAGQGIIEIDTMHPNVGSIIMGNVIQSQEASMPADAIRADLRGSICKNNIVRNVSTIVATATSASTINTENIVS